MAAQSKSQLKGWLKTARRGRCPCGNVLTSARAKICKDDACHKEYHRLYHLDRTGTALREVVGRSEPKDHRVVLKLSCGHTLEVEAHRSEYYTRKRCETCQGRKAPRRNPARRVTASR